MIETDVLVIGAGPAGSAASKHAALGGANVILIDKKSEIGTPKRCAEGIYDHGLKWLNIEANPQWAVQRINGGTIIAPDMTRLTLDERVLPEKGYIIERKVFDKYMAMDAARAGAEVMVKTLAKTIKREKGEDFFSVTCQQMDESIDIKTKIIIAADGPESRIAKALGINSTTKPQDMISGVQYEMVGVNCERMDLIELHLGAFADGGYAWVFPKGDDIANVGIGVSSASKKPAIEYLDEFIKKYPPLNNAKAVELNVGGNPIGGLIGQIYDDNLLVCGDAAGQVDPVTGGGIILGMLGGMAAGKVAAKAIKDKDYSASRLKEYEVLYDEYTQGAIPKLAVARDVYLSLDDNDLNQIVNAFIGLDLKNMSLSDFVKVFFKLSPRLALKFRKLFKIIL
ncbi:geranylgeranyl reductase family protein [Methanobrevibacter olleyae]|uniref:Digeranylgeranylglycerophospholipid reductase n=1 Tax=Methanobrevibacter olleyae TaxID=294671 RepID=A0A126QZ00_METOL|nr:NAD(P)/FAD-dependent oxidoreductase [Methanobrevibacter olleyae]AMK15380.1 geranylgeranyl reductase family protein [Methanobrevibacter olleyae]SFL49095.1 digeranylgeranylglycerophospholipid reductase [Methanobrevibacter olleyae]